MLFNRQFLFRWPNACGIKLISQYVQGQSPRPRIREYFYFIDHQGRVFLDDAKVKNFTSCFKEKNFLVFFFSRVQRNETGQYPEFPYISLCGRERNYIRCYDVPFVYTHISDNHIFYGHAGYELKELFKPTKLCMQPGTGRVYHPAPRRVGGVGLVSSSLTMEISNRFRFANGERSPPTHFLWDGKKFLLET